MFKEVTDVVPVQEVACDSSTSTPCSAFLCRQSLPRSLSSADLHLPNNPNKKAEIIQTFAPNANLELICRKIEEDLAKK